MTMTAKLYDYLLASSVRESAVLARLRAETARLPMAAMQIAPDQGQFMAWLVQLIGAKRTLEVGVFTGYSALWVAQALPQDGGIVACDVSEEWTRVARRYWEEAGVAHKIDLRLGPALQTLDDLLAQGQAGTFDFAFIDADKTRSADYYERVLRLLRRGGVMAIDNVAQGQAGTFDFAFIDADKTRSADYYERVLRLLRRGGVMAIDNVAETGLGQDLWDGRVAESAADDPDTVALRALNAKIAADSRVMAVMLPLADGLTLVRR